MKILSIGNSFSQDAQRWLHNIATVDNFELDTYNLFIGGCSLETHWQNIENNALAYSFEGNNGRFIKTVSIEDALNEYDYDIITLQQASGDSGKPQTFFPYIQKIAEYVRAKQPQAKLYFHMTWSYEIGAQHGHYYRYNNDSKEMFRRISDCAEMASKIFDIPIIPVGKFIQYLRENTEVFDYINGGLSLCRDGFHLSETYGRFAAASVWYKTLTGKKVKAENFIKENEGFDAEIVDIIIEKLEEFSQQ